MIQNDESANKDDDDDDELRLPRNESELLEHRY